jgi:hypothetical protein
MKFFKMRKLGWWILVSFLMMTLIPACSRNIIPARDIKSVIGKWQGYGYNSKMVQKFNMEMLIRGDGKWLMRLDTGFLSYGQVFDGDLWAEDEKFIIYCSTPGLSGTAELRSASGTLWLMYRSNDGQTRADLTLVY